jgi:hypothetical protein
MPLIRGAGIVGRTAIALTNGPRGTKNSSRRISPEWMGNDMIIVFVPNDRDVVSILVLKAKATELRSIESPHLTGERTSESCILGMKSRNPCHLFSSTQIII